MRFYFGASGSLSAQLLSGTRAHGGLYVSWYLSAVTGVANVELGDDLNGAAAATVARIASDRAARRAFWDVVKSGTADHANRKPWYPRMRFPLVGKTDLTCEGLWLNHQAHKVFLVHRILQCTHPFAFSKLFYSLSDSAGRGSSRTDSTSAADADADMTSASSRTPIEVTASGTQSRDKSLRPMEIQVPTLDLEPFPDLSSKTIARVTRPREGGGGARGKPLDREPERTAFAPMGSTGGESRAVDLTSGSHSPHEREPRLLTQLMLEIMTEVGAGGRIRSPLGGTGSLRVSVFESTLPSEVPVWIFLATREVSTARRSREHQVAVTFRDSYFDGPGYSVHVFQASSDLEWTSDVCDLLAKFDPSNADLLDPCPGLEYLEGGSGQSSGAMTGVTSLAAAIAAQLKRLSANQAGK